MARICLQLRPLVGVPCSELAEVWPPPAGGALRGAADGSGPSAASPHSLSKRLHDRGEAVLRPEQPGRTLQTFRGTETLF